jgi:hypothetical protein
MSSTTVSTVALTLQPGKNILKHDCIKENFQVPSQELKQLEETISNGITLEIHQEIDGTIQKKGIQIKKVETKPVAADKNNERSVKNDSKGEKAEEGQPNQEKIINGVLTLEALGNEKQEMLLLDGPGQRYRLEEGGSIPELKTDREILIQVSPVTLTTRQYLIPRLGRYNRAESC